MDEEVKKEEQKDERIVGKIEITIYRDGNGQVSGPLVNKALCKAMLAMAAQIVDDWRPQIAGVKPSDFDKIKGGIPFPRG